MLFSNFFIYVLPGNRQFDHLIDWNNSKVLKTEAYYSKRLTSEAWFIKSHPHVMNRSDGDSLPQVYRRLITS